MDEPRNTGYEGCSQRELWRMMIAAIARAELGITTHQQRTFNLAQLREARIMAHELFRRGDQGQFF